MEAADQPEDVGQLNIYLNYYAAEVSDEHDRKRGKRRRPKGRTAYRQSVVPPVGGRRSVIFSCGLCFRKL